MTNKEKKQYLRRAYRINNLVRSHRAELEIYKAAIESIGGGNMDGQPHAPRHDGSTGEIKIIDKKIDLEAQLRCEIADLKEQWREIHDTINGVKDINERLVLRYKYIERREWSDISTELNYSVERIYQIHRDALEHLTPPETPQHYSKL